MEEGGSAKLLVVGANYRSAEAELRDRLFLDAAAQTAFLERLRAEAGMEQAIVLSTCDRVEVQGLTGDPVQAGRKVAAMLSGGAGVERAALGSRIYEMTGEEALAHVFGIPAGLDSQMLGEAQIAGQMKEAHARARELGLMGQELDQILQGAYAAARRIRAETEIGEGPVSIAAAAAQVARDLFGNLAELNLLVLGLGDVGELLLQHFRQVGIASAEMAGPSRRVGQEAARLGVGFREMADIENALVRADIVVTDVGLGRTLIDAAQLRRALKARRYRPILLIDGSIPPDTDPQIERVDQAFLYRLEDIERLARANRRGREQAAANARAILREELAAFRKRGAVREAVPGLVALRRRFEAEREAVLAAHPQADAAEATRLLLQRLLHGPSKAMRQIAEQGDAADLKDWVTVNRVLHSLFDLNLPGEGGASAPAKPIDSERTGL